MPRNRNCQLSLRLSEKELALFERKCAATGLSKTEFLMKLLKSTKIQVFQFSDTIKTLHSELRKIGVNLNQIAYLMNIGYDVQAKYELHQMTRQYEEVLDRLKHFLDAPLVNAQIISGGEKCPSEM